MNELDELRQRIAKFSAERDWDKFHSPKNLAAALAVEAAELLEIFQWLNDAEAKAAPAEPKIKARSAEEMADIFIYLLRISSKMGVDLIEAAETKLKSSAKKYPVETSRGDARKYNQKS